MQPTRTPIVTWIGTALVMLTSTAPSTTAYNAARVPNGFELMPLSRGDDLDPAVGGTVGDINAFCALPETVATWDVKSGCNGAPQFLSAFCPDHVRVRDGALVCTVDDTPCAQPDHSNCMPPTHPYGGAAINGPTVGFGNISVTMKVASGTGVVTTVAA